LGPVFDNLRFGGFGPVGGSVGLFVPVFGEFGFRVGGFPVVFGFLGVWVVFLLFMVLVLRILLGG